MRIGTRRPVWLRFGHIARYDQLSKADWADVFCDLYQQVFDEESSATPADMMDDAERRIKLMKMQNVR